MTQPQDAGADDQPPIKPARAPAAPRRGQRSLPIASFVLIFLALVQILVRESLDWSWVPFTLAAAAQFIFAAALLWAPPSDRPLHVYGAWVIAGSALLTLIPAFITDDLVASTPLLGGVPHWLTMAASLLLAVGVVLLALAYGVIHSRGGWTVVWIGALLAVSGIGLVTTRPTEGMQPVDVLILSAAQLVPLAWAYMCAVFLGINLWLVRGAAVMLVYIAMSQLVAWMSPGPDVNIAYLRFGLGLLAVTAWAFLIFGARTLTPASSKEAHSLSR